MLLENYLISGCAVAWIGIMFYFFLKILEK